MTRCASGHREPNRIVFNVGSEFIEPLYRDFEYDERLAIDNNCGGDQRYNLQGRFDKPELWKSAGHGIRVKNLCFITDVTVTSTEGQTRVGWRLEGSWDRIPDATLSLYLQECSNGVWRDVAALAKSVTADAGSAVVELPPREAGAFRVILRRHGDPHTGGVSHAF